MRELLDFQDDAEASHAAKMSKDEGKLYTPNLKPQPPKTLDPQP